MIKKTTVIHQRDNLIDVVPTLNLPVPEYLYIATDNARCPKADVFIKEGDHVKLGQKIGVRHAAFFDQPIHATCSGTFEGYEKHYHRSGKQVNFFKIHNDFKDELDPSIVERSDEEIAKLDRVAMRDILKECSSVGLGGSSFPTYIKFDTDKKIDTILLNGIECEPFLSADHRLLMQDSDRLIKGTQLLLQAFGAKEAKICIKKKYHDIATVYERMLPLYGDSRISVCKVGNFYPQGWEVAMIKSATGIEVETGHLPAEYGIINFNVTTVVGIYEAIKHNMPIYERYISVVGDGINFPANFVVRVGTPISYLIKASGGYKDPDVPKDLIFGGPMMGANLTSDDAICTKTVTSLIILNKREWEEEPCMRCGSCVFSCPVSLQPISIRNAMKELPLNKEKIKDLTPLKCIECGLCTYSCPSKIDLLNYVRRAKLIARMK